MKTPKPRPTSPEAESTHTDPLGVVAPEGHELIDLYDLLDYYSAHEKNRGGDWDFGSKPFDRFELRPN